MAGEVTVLNHGHPGGAIGDQAHPEGLTDGAAGADQDGGALTGEQIAQGVPAELEGALGRLDQALLLLLKGPAENGNALLPVHIWIGQGVLRPFCRPGHWPVQSLRVPQRVGQSAPSPAGSLVLVLVLYFWIARC